MSAARTGKSNKKNKDTKSSLNNRVREERADAFRRGINTVLALVLISLFIFGAWQTWVFLGKPGWSLKPGTDSTEYVELYFYDSAVTYLVPVHRSIILAPNDSRTSRAIEAFAEGPRDPSLGRIYPAGIDPPSVTIRGDEAIIDLPMEIWSSMGGSTKERAFLDALTLTVNAAGECSSTRIMIASEQVEMTPEGYDLTESLSIPENFNHVPDSGLQGESKWVRVYFLDSTGRYLIPISLEVDSGVDDAREAVTRMLGNPPQLSYPPPLPICPRGLGLERLIIENGIATIDLSVPDISTVFIDYDINTFRTALYLSLNKCCNIRDIKLKLNARDIESYSRFDSLPQLSNIAGWNPERPALEPEPIDANPEGEVL